MHGNSVPQSQDHAALPVPSGDDSLGAPTVTLLCVLIASLMLNVYLLRTRHPSPQQSSRTSPSVGSTIGPLSASDVSGKTVDVAWQDAPATILYYFSPDCVWCKRNANAIKSLRDTTAGNYRFLAVSPKSEGAEVFERTYNLPSAAVVFRPSNTGAQQLNFQGTPDTFVIDNKGVLRAHWAGAYGGGNRDQIISYFKLKPQDLTAVSE